MKSAKHTKYEGNPRHAKGLQILSDREYKRLAKRAASMALAAAMAASTLCAPALAVDYNAEDGTVHTDVNENQEVISWQEKLDQIIGNIFNHTQENDFEINIKPGTTTDQVLNVGSGTTGLDITVDGVTAEVEGDNVIKVEDGTQVGVTIKDSDLTSTGGDAAISIDGDSVMDIEGSTIKGGGKEHAAIEAKGNSKVALDGSHVENEAGTGVSVEPNATLIIGGAEIQPGTLILSPVIPEEPVETTIEAEDIGIQSEGTVVIESGATADINTEQNVGIQLEGGTMTIQQDAVADVDQGVQLQDDSETVIEGTLGTLSVSMGDTAQMTVKEAGDVSSSDPTGETVLEESGLLSADAVVVEESAKLESKGEFYAEEVEVKDNAQVSVGGYNVLEEVTLADDALLKVVDEGTLAVNTLTLADEYKNPVELGGMFYLETLKKGEESLADAALLEHLKNSETFDAVGTGTRFATYDDKNKVMEVYHQIGEGDDRQEVEIDLGKMMVDTLLAKTNFKYEFIGPGMYPKYNLSFVNKSGHEYIYKDQSFEISPFITGIDSLTARTPNKALQALYGVSKDTELSLENLILAEKKLKTDGYDFNDGKGTQYFDSLEEYYLAYINYYENLEGKGPYSSLDEAMKEAPKYFGGGLHSSFGQPQAGALDSSPGRNAQYVVSSKDELERLQQLIKDSGCNGELYVVQQYADGSYQVQLKDTSGMLVRFFYREVLGVGFSEQELPSTGSALTGGIDGYIAGNRGYTTIGDFQDKNGEKYLLNEELFKLFGTEETPFVNGEKNLNAYFLLDGNRAGNSLQNYSFGWTNTITLSRIDPDPVPPTTDPEEPTPDPDPEEPTLILTPVPEEEEVPEEETPLAPAPVEEIPEEETPLVDAPVIDESLEEIGEEDVPLASAPKTGDESGAFGLMAVLSGMALAVMSFFGKKKEQ